ncbi:11205_t:CDS:2 [Dentiscutata heterogama]|uniref:11205_t:CDS:1 n=1 Tax=Dentiscutata heterogama TaxID=1316150 RepID=A0ACA9L3J4_9GLOM|nr:11205_t:CDS:2 [Dentiscutata heterogama]
MEVRRIHINENENIECRKRNTKVSNRMKEKVDNNNEAVKKVKINGEFAKASIRLSLPLNLMSMRYVRSKGLTWKRFNEDDEVVGCVPGVEIDVDGVIVVEEFYVMHELTSDVILGMPMMKSKDRRENEFVDVRRVKDEFMENDDNKKKNRIENPIRTHSVSCGKVDKCYQNGGCDKTNGC